MIKDILVTLPTGEAPSFAMDYAAAVAKAFDAHITGVAFAQDLAAVGALFDGAAAVILDHYRREVEAAAEAAKVRFERAWQREGLLAESMVLSAGAVNLPELLARTARSRFDNPSPG